MCKPFTAILRLVETLKTIISEKGGVYAILIVVLSTISVVSYNESMKTKVILEGMEKSQVVMMEILRFVDLRLANIERNNK